MLEKETVEGIEAAVQKILSDSSYAKAAEECSRDFRSCSGVKGAADHIENAPNPTDGKDIMKDFGKLNVISQVLYNVATILLAILIFHFVSTRFLWIYIVAAVVLSSPINKKLQKSNYDRLAAKQ